VGGVDRIEPPVEDRQDLLNKAHLFEHFGAEAIVKSIHSNGFHWPMLKEQAVALVSKCHLCQKFNIAKHKFHPLRPISSNLPGDHWTIDLAGSLSTTNQSNNYILIMRDIFSRFIILRAISDKKSDTIVQQLVSVYCDFGIPKIVQSDNGTEFVNGKMKLFKKAAGFDHRLVPPYHPRANGAAENTVWDNGDT
jgi:transposase InsO family protein